MKIRNGFVSNSSSSSFVVGFEKIPETIEETMHMMFKEGERSVCAYNEDYHVYEIAEQVFKDMNEKEPITKEQFIEAISSGWFDGYPEHDYTVKTPPQIFRSEWEKENPGEKIWDNEEASNKWSELINIEWEKQEKLINKAAMILVEKEWPELKHLHCYHFIYGDEGGPFFSTMEHGNIFRHLPHLQISHH